MYEAVITIVGVEASEAEPQILYPTTKVIRVEFDSKAGMARWLDELNKAPHYDIANVEHLKAS
jgi:hypothetical protein